MQNFIAHLWIFVGQVLKSHSGLVSSRHLSEELDKLHITYMDANSRLKSVAGADSSISDGGGSDDIEAEANIYFHQMFSGQLSNDATVQMLARFKESTEKRLILQKSTYIFLNCLHWVSGTCICLSLLCFFSADRVAVDLPLGLFSLCSKKAMWPLLNTCFSFFHVLWKVACDHCWVKWKFIYFARFLYNLVWNAPNIGRSHSKLSSYLINLDFCRKEVGFDHINLVFSCWHWKFWWNGSSYSTEWFLSTNMMH